MNEAVSSWVGRTAIFLSVCFVLMAVLGDIINRLVPTKKLRDRVWAWLCGQRSASQKTSSISTPSPVTTSHSDD